MDKKSIRKIFNVLFSLCLGGGILWWMYREFDFSRVSHVIMEEMDWGMMMFSMVFGITAQLFRGLRWKLALLPIGETTRNSTCIHAVFLSYAASLIIPRAGEFTRCGVLKKYDGVSFAKSIGTVLTERIIDSLIIAFVVAAVLLCQLPTFMKFFATTGAWGHIKDFFAQFTATGYWVTAICLVITAIFLYLAAKKLSTIVAFRKVVKDVWTGIISVKKVSSKWLFMAYTIGIWVSYFLHFYITFFCFDFTANLAINVALVAFVAGTIAVVVPTPNGLGPWHFAVKTVFVLYAVQAVNAETFVLIVHTLQTALIPILAIFSLVCLALRKKNTTTTENA